MAATTDERFGVRDGVGGRWRAIRSVPRDHPELVALASVLIGLVVRPKGALGTAWWGGTAIGSLIAAVAVLRGGGK